MSEFTVSNANANAVTSDDSGNVFVGETTGDVVAYDQNGNVDWTNTDEIGTGESVGDLHEENGLLYVAQGGDIYILNASDGTTRTSAIGVHADYAIHSIWGEGGDSTWLSADSKIYRFDGTTSGWSFGGSVDNPNGTSWSSIVTGPNSVFAVCTSVNGVDNVFKYDKTTLSLQNSAEIFGNNGDAVDYNDSTGRIYLGGNYINEFSQFAQELYAYSTDLSTEYWRYDVGSGSASIETIRYEETDSELYATGKDGDLYRYRDNADDPKLAATYSTSAGSFTDLDVIGTNDAAAIVRDTEVQSVDDGSYQILLESIDSTQVAATATINSTTVQPSIEVIATQTTVSSLMNSETQISQSAGELSVTATPLSANAENLYEKIDSTPLTVTAVNTVAAAEEDNTSWIIYDSEDEQHRASLVEYTGTTPDWERGQAFSRVFIFDTEEDDAYDKLKREYARYLRDGTVTVSTDYRGTPRYTQNPAPNATQDDYLFRVDPNPTADMEAFWCVVTNITDATRVAESGGSALQMTMVPLAPTAEYNRREARRVFEVSL